MKNLFESRYVGEKVINITNENDPGDIYCHIVGYNITGRDKNVALVTFIDEKGEIFNGGGIVIPDTPEMRKLLNCVNEMFPSDQKAKFNFLCEFKNYVGTMQYILKSSLGLKN